MGCVFLWILFTVIHSFQSNFRSVLKWLRHMNDLSVFRYGFFFHAISDIRLQYLRAYCSYCTRMALLGIRHRDIVRGHDTCQVGFAFVPCLVLVLQTPLFRVIPRSYGRKDKCGTFSPSTLLGGVFFIFRKGIILEKGECHYTSRPAVVLDSVVRQGPGHLVLDGYHCLILSEALPSSWGGETWLNNKFVHDTRWEAKRHTPPVREILLLYRY